MVYVTSPRSVTQTANQTPVRWLDVPASHQTSAKQDVVTVLSAKPKSSALHRQHAMQVATGPSAVPAIILGNAAQIGVTEPAPTTR